MLLPAYGNPKVKLDFIDIDDLQFLPPRLASCYKALQLSLTNKPLPASYSRFRAFINAFAGKYRVPMENGGYHTKGFACEWMTDANAHLLACYWEPEYKRASGVIGHSIEDAKYHLKLVNRLIEDVAFYTNEKEKRAKKNKKNPHRR